MANEATNVGIKDSWSLMSFKALKGKMQLGTFVNQENGETFKSCIFTDENQNRTFVSFSSKLGELTPAQIKAQKNELQVVLLNSDRYSLCRVGEGNWEDVDI